MKALFSHLALPTFIACVGCGVLAIVLFFRNYQHTQLTFSSVTPQCAHWAIFRTTQLIGIPMNLEEVQRLLPNQSNGHTLLQIIETFAKIGVEAEGYRDDWDSLAKLSFPCIVHLSNPDHYVVVSGMESERGYIHIFDDAGNRTRQQRSTFEKRWTGYSIRIRKSPDFFLAKVNDSKPHVFFDHLTLDKGDIPAIGEPTEFVFPIYNFGKADLIVEDVKVDCVCLESEKPMTPIPPGGTGVIKLFYFVEPKRGVFTQAAAVKTNDPDNPIVLISACGFTGVEVRIEPPRINLHRFFAGRENTFRCFISYTGEWNDFQIELESTDLIGVELLRHECLPLDQSVFSSTLIEVQSKAEISRTVGKNNRFLNLVFRSNESLSERISGTIILKTNIKGYERFTLHVSGEIISPVQAFPNVADIRNDDECLVTLVSLVDEPFRIVGIDCDSAVSCQYDPSKLLKEHCIRIKKNAELASCHFNISYQLEKDTMPINLPLPLLVEAFAFY
ncbi:MAG: cysteine peptidase family C39 domain-containing protein [Bacteroidales bacterium]|nr:cysteine peptidase family C39 domain-containing protein [Bacteroidales bacterium]